MESSGSNQTPTRFGFTFIVALRWFIFFVVSSYFLFAFYSVYPHAWVLMLMAAVFATLFAAKRIGNFATKPFLVVIIAIYWGLLMYLGWANIIFKNDDGFGETMMGALLLIPTIAFIVLGFIEIKKYNLRGKGINIMGIILLVALNILSIFI